MTKTGIVYSFQIAVYIGSHVHIITKTDADFHTLESDMKKLYPNASEVRINEKLPTTTQNWLKVGEEKANVL